MLSSLPSPRSALFWSGTLIAVGAACGKGGDQRAAADSGTSTAAVSTAADSASMPDSTIRTDSAASPVESASTRADRGASRAAASQDTPPAASSRGTSAGSTEGEGSGAHGVRPVKPNIDPGRIGTKTKVTESSSSASAASPPTSTPPTDSTAPASPSPAGGQQDQALQYDAKSNTVTFQLIGGPAGFQFNGFSSGGATLTVPSKANVVINFINKDGTPHSAEVISGEGAIPNAGGDPAISRAYTNQLTQGLPQEGTDAMRFSVPASGSYRIFCGVPGHGLSGMWIWMKVDPAAKTPSFGATKG
jgi:sulfocyanin SoxE-like protein